MINRLLIFCLFFIFVLFLYCPKVLAADHDLIINEVMADPSCSDDKCEWIELYNNNDLDSIPLKGWLIDNKTVTEDFILAPTDYVIIAKDSSEFKKAYPDITTTNILEINLGLTNGGDTITIANPDKTYTESFSWTKSAKTDFSWEKIDPDESELDENATDDNWQLTFTKYGTPGQENSHAPKLPKPLAPTDLIPADHQYLYKPVINFSWQEADTQDLTYEFLLSKNEDASDAIVDEKTSETSYTVDSDLDWGTYYWQVVADNGVDQNESTINKFVLQEPHYSGAIIINEMMPNPSADETKNEWIELYNNSSESVDLTDWYLTDIKGSIHQYKIKNITIAPSDYIVFNRSETGITLNNDQDGVRLYQPNDNLLFESSVFSNGSEDWSWARQADGIWSWTIKPTPTLLNVFDLPATETDTDDEKPVINKNPIKVKTGSFKKYEAKLISIEGTVTETVGHTFYLNDGSGSAKVYIQDQTEIKKPPMHKGDIFGIIGVVNLYRSSWRILPREQDDIWLIKAANNSATAKTASSQSTSSKSQKNTAEQDNASKANGARAPNQLDPLGIKEVKAATDRNDQAANGNVKPWWVSLVEAMIGLAVVFMVLLVIKVRSRISIKQIGGHFGQDDT